MNKWTIKVLDYGHIPCDKGRLTPGYDEGLVLNTPFLGFLLQNGEENVVVDCGVNEKFFEGGAGWGGAVPVGGAKYVKEALAKENLNPDDIDKVIYTHLHNDHAGNCDLFRKALTIYQKDEFDNLTNPLPSQMVLRDYDPDVADRLRALPNKLVVDGDIELANGLKLYKIPGHTKGSQCIKVETENGTRLIIGDICPTYYALFPWMDRMVREDGSIVNITPMPCDVNPVLVNLLTYDHYAFYDSLNKIKALVPEYKKEYFVPGHEPSLLFTGV